MILTSSCFQPFPFLPFGRLFIYLVFFFFKSYRVRSRNGYTTNTKAELIFV